MMKRVYLKPAMRVVVLNTRVQLLTASNPTVTRTAGNADLNYEGGGSGPARARQHDVWDEEEEE
jgi:hypothetical protein